MFIIDHLPWLLNKVSKTINNLLRRRNYSIINSHFERLTAGVQTPILADLFK
jgi:hypothetical protein